MTPTVHVSGFRCPVVTLISLVGVSGALAAEVRVTATADRDTIRLSESLQVTVTVEGPAPLRVEPSSALIDDLSAEVWQLRPMGPPTVTGLANHREQWRQVLRAEPFVPGDPLRLRLAPVRVLGDLVSVPPLDVTVTTPVTDVSTASIRPITGIEELSPPDSTPGRWRWWMLVATGAGVGGIGWWLHRRRRVAPLSANEAARRDWMEAVTRLAHGDDPARVADRVAESLRHWLAHHSGLSAETMTTDELLAARPWPVEVEQLLRICDRIRFARDDTANHELAEALQRMMTILSLTP